MQYTYSIYISILECCIFVNGDDADDFEDLVFLSIFNFSAEVLNACHFSAMILTYLNKYRTENICIHR